MILIIVPPVINQYYESQLLNNIFNHFWNRWQKECLCNLRETHKPNKLPTTLPIIKVNDTVDKLPSSQWKLGLVTKLIPGRDTKVRVRFSRTTTIITKSINKPYLLEDLNTSNTSATLNKTKAAFISNMKTTFRT